GGATPNFSATDCAADFAQANPPSVKSGARSDFWLSHTNPAKCQPMVPFRSATTLFGIPALIRDWAPIMLRVRPAQLTTMVVDGEGTMSRTRRTSSAPGTLIPFGIDIRVYSSNGRLSSTLSSVPSCIIAFSSAALMLGVPLSCSTNSPKALLGTCTPENNTKPAFRHAVIPPSRNERSV